ncbi:MAG: PfkB family carbohydrate kinase [Saccharofermentanales bacterium]|jgi:2-dehydro-3-deoxygluconokinase
MKVITFGEIMMRLKAPYGERILQSPMLEATFGGAEANVAVSLANYGFDAMYLTALPDHKIGDACIKELRSFNVNTDGIVRKPSSRLGIYYVEPGANQLPSKVIYDRSHSAFSQIEFDDFEWDTILRDATWFHTSGITPALTQNCFDVTYEVLKQVKKQGIKISIDLNYRNKLWKYGKSAEELMPKLVEQADVIIANEEDVQKTLGIGLEHEFRSDALDLKFYERLSKRVMDQYKNLTAVAITLRESESANVNGWSACLKTSEEFVVSNKYIIRDIVDRVGGGDSFSAGLIYGLNTYETVEETINFAVAASCLKHSIIGDFNRVDVEDVIKLMTGDGSGRVVR